MRTLALAAVATGVAVSLTGPSAAMPAAAAAPTVASMAAAAPWLIPHRGAGAPPDGINPESTMSAYMYAVGTLGLRTVDVDLQLTASGALAVHHDPTMHDTTCGAAKVSALTTTQYQACQYADGEHPLVFSDLLDTFGASVVYTPEPKSWTDGTAAKLLKQIRAYGLQQQMLVQGTSLAGLDKFTAAGVPTERGSVSSDAVANQKGAWVSTLKAHGIRYVSVSQACSDQTFYHYAHNGVRVLAWTVDTAASYDRLMALPAPPVGVYSNNPPTLTGDHS